MVKVPAPEALDDTTLVRAAMGGAQWAHEEIYRRYVDMVYATTLKLCPWTAEVDDIVQEVFVTVLENIGRVREPERFPGWLKTTAIRAAMGGAKKLRLRRRLGLVPAAEVDYSVLVSPAAAPEDRADLLRLLDALKMLPPDLRVPWSLKRIDHHTVDEIVELTSQSRSTVKRRIARAEAELQRQGFGGSRES